MTPFRHLFIASFGTALLLAATNSWGAGPDTDALVRQGRIMEAMEAASEQAKLRPADMPTQELYIDLLLNLGLAPQAQQKFTERAQASPLDPDSHYLLARATLDPRDARQSYERALKLNPTHARSHMGIAAVHSALGKSSDAEAAYARAVSMDPALIEAWIGLVRARLQEDDLASATAVTVQGLDANPAEAQLTFTLVTLDPSQGASRLPPAIKRTPFDAPLQSLWASHLLTNGRHDEALDVARQALAIDPTNKDAARVAIVADELVQGLLTTEQALAVEAARREMDVAALDALVNQAPKSILVRLARASSQLDDAKALTDLLAAHALDPTHVEACAAVGHALMAANRAPEAIPPLTCAAQVRTWDMPLQVTLAMAQSGAGQHPAALQSMQQLADQRPYDVIILSTYAQVLLGAGQPDKAYNVIKRSMARIPDPRLGAAFVLVATAAGHKDEAADFLDALAEQSGNAVLKERAAALRTP